ncbi:MAG: S-methyl-5-thioribose-1-phosphate isomerase [Eggerthellaceae bacterium]|nr:S-methyl-5-thioribose-1-phosphate isomerase [Eggerthellaceae bacterium]
MFDLDQLPRTLELVKTESGAFAFDYIDERLLPGSLMVERTEDWRCVVDAIKTLAVRGAPAIGVAGAAAIALWAGNRGVSKARAAGCTCARDVFIQDLEMVAHEVETARPTAVNLAWGVRRMRSLALELLAEDHPLEMVADALFVEVKAMERQDEATNRAMGAHGADLIPADARLLTHCNAGSLATVFFGTALGVIYAAAEQGKVKHVYADETRPVDQGARLTVWELAKAGLPVTLICDNMAASLMAKGEVDAIVVGADRITANGDAANKIGTYGLAVLASHHGIPFYVVAPSSTLDFSMASGDQIVIEHRDSREVLPMPIDGVEVYNPAFDMTPAPLITKIITERGAFEPDKLAAAHSDLFA